MDQSNKRMLQWAPGCWSFKDFLLNGTVANICNSIVRRSLIFGCDSILIEKGNQVKLDILHEKHVIDVFKLVLIVTLLHYFNYYV